jgi:hypothetical protein
MDSNLRTDGISEQEIKSFQKLSNHVVWKADTPFQLTSSLEDARTTKNRLTFLHVSLLMKIGRAHV